MATGTLPAGRMRMDSSEIGVGEAARILGVAENTVRRFIENGQLRARRVNPDDPRSWRRVSRADVEAFKARRENPEGDAE